SNCDKELTAVEFDEDARWLIVLRRSEDGAAALLVCNLAEHEQSVPISLPDGEWRLAIWSGDRSYGGAQTQVSPPTHLRGVGKQAVSLSDWQAALYLNAS